MKKSISLLLLVMLLPVIALADTLSMDGKVDAKKTTEVYAPIGGTVDQVVGEVGQQVTADDVLISLRTEKVYSDENGTVTGIFGEPGDAAETVAARYGAVLYIEQDSAFIINASTDNAYNSVSAKFVHVGETVYARCKSNSSREGVGRIKTIEGTNFTVEIDEGSFIPGDTVELYRDKAHTSGKHIGSGTVARQNPVAVTGTGSIVRIAVKDGDTVKKGDLLMETLTGTFDGYRMTGTDITADQEGVIATLNATQGSPITKDSVVAVLYKREDMRVSAELPEDSLDELHEGDSVHIELSADESCEYTGTVTMISGVASESAGGEVTYRVLIDFTPDDAVRYGMSVVVETLEPETAEDDEEVEEADVEEQEDEADAEEAEAASKMPADGSFPFGDGFPSGEGFPEGFPENFPEGGFPDGAPQQRPSGN